MLIELVPKIGEYRAVRSLRTFFRSGFFVAVVTALMVAAELFSLELPVYYGYLVLGVAGLLLCDDALPLIPIVCCSYMTVSAENNPAQYPQTSVFYQTSFQIQLIVILSVAVAFLLLRLVTALRRNRAKKMPSLAIGFLLLGVSYVLGGAFSEYYGLKTALFGATEIASLCAFYFYFYYTVDWKKTEKSYLFGVFLALGFGLAVEIVGMYSNPNVYDAAGNVNRHWFFTGWGMYNNVGCAMAMCIPAPFYFAATRKNGWIWSAAGCFFLLALILAQSRGSMLFGAIVFLACAATVLVVSKGRERYRHLTVFVVMLLAGLIAVWLAHEDLRDLFSAMLDYDFFNDNGRFAIYRGGWTQFLERPLFGVGFYQCKGPQFGQEFITEDFFLPPRYHNTYVQLIASGGIVAFVCYAYHRVGTALVFFRNPTRERTFCALSVGALLLTSLVDCHFFNFGPGLLYSVFLVFAECVGERRGRSLRSERAQ